MAALLIGGNNSYVGEGLIGENGFIYTASGSLAFTGTAIRTRHRRYRVIIRST